MVPRYLMDAPTDPSAHVAVRVSMVTVYLVPLSIVNGIVLG